MTLCLQVQNKTKNKGWFTDLIILLPDTGGFEGEHTEGASISAQNTSAVVVTHGRTWSATPQEHAFLTHQI